MTLPLSRRLGALVFVGGLALAACGSDEAGSTDTGTDAAPAAEAEASTAALSIADPWSRQPAGGQTTTAVYGVVTNGSDEDITAIAAATSVTDTVELHQVTMNDEGQMSMREKEGGYVIPAGESFTFEPGGPHIKMFGIDPATYPDMFDVTLEFDNGSTLDFTAEVRAIGDDAAAEMDGEMEEDG
jgi:copper(I)-binding protein